MNLSRQIPALLVLALFAVVVTFGLRATMMTNKDGNMSNCPLMNGVSYICRMNAFEHIATWQSLFTATIPMVILLLVGLAILFVSSLFSINDPDSLRDKFFHYQRRNFISQIFNHLHLVFRKGILHPKVFDFVSIL